MNSTRILAVAVLAASSTAALAAPAGIRYADHSDQRTVANSLITEVRNAVPATAVAPRAIRYADHSDRRTVANSIVEGVAAKTSTAVAVARYSDFSATRSFAN
jgi:hypothetical protein